MKKLFIGTVVVAMVLELQHSANAQTTKPWVAPVSANNINNPLKGNAVATKAGKKTFMQLCSICHGVSGRGDGQAGMALNPRPANFTSAKVQSQSDGVLFWKMTNGRVPMAAYKDILTEEQRWQLVNYIRTLKSK